MLHSKTMVVDGRWTVIGSCNLDPRSLQLNLEFLGLIQSPALAAAALKICKFEMSQSVRVTKAMVRERAWYQRLVDRLAWSFRWFL
jgi:cardiolipin synthase